MAQDKGKIELQLLEGIKDENLGVYRDIFSAKSSFKGQDGGVVTALLANGITEGLFDAAIVVNRSHGYCAEAVVAQNVDEVLSASGTKYLRVNVTTKLRELISQGKKRIAIVCTPCEAKAARKIQQNLKFPCQITVVGLFCFEAFNAAKLRVEIQNRLNININSAEKTQVQRGKSLVQSEGKVHSCRVKDLGAVVEKACAYCDDFTSRFADISVGSVGSREGFSTVIVRSPVGEKLVEKLVAQREVVDNSEVIRIAQHKQERSQKVFTDQRKAS